MNKSRFTESEILEILNEAQDSGNNIAVCRKYHISDQTFYRWRSRYKAMMLKLSEEASVEFSEICDPQTGYTPVQTNSSTTIIG